MPRSSPAGARSNRTRPICAGSRHSVCNGQIEESGVAAAVLGHPATGIAWLTNKLAAHDVALEPGQIVLSGSFIRIVEARPGETFHADFGPYGSVSCHFN